jgi:HEAT repeat protein
MNCDTAQSILDELAKGLTDTQKHINSLFAWAEKLPDTEEATRIRTDLAWMVYHSRRVRRAIQDMQDTIDTHKTIRR